MNEEKCGNSMTQNKNKNLWKVIIAIAVVICLGAVVFLIWNVFNGEFGGNDYRQTEQTEMVTYNPNQHNDETDDVIPEGVVSELADNPINFEELQNTNADLYAWVEIPNTNVNYPIAQSSKDMDEDFYLDHNIYKDYKFAGTIYSQRLNKKDFSDPVTVLYGHNMLNGTMFNNLHKFEDAGFFNENQYIYIYTEGHILTYMIFAAFDYDNRHILYNFDFRDKQIFDDYLQSCLQSTAFNANIRKGITFNEDDKILILSTCSNYDNDSRYLVQGVLVNDEFTR